MFRFTSGTFSPKNTPVPRNVQASDVELFAFNNSQPFIRNNTRYVARSTLPRTLRLVGHRSRTRQRRNTVKTSEIIPRRFLFQATPQSYGMPVQGSKLLPRAGKYLINSIEIG